MAVTKDQQKAAEPAKDGKDAKSKGKKDVPVDPDAELSEEDLELKNNLELMVQRVSDGDAGVQKAALAAICNEVQSSTTAMSAVPKPLKFLVPHTDALKAAFEAMSPKAPNRPALADILSVLASTIAGKEGERLGLHYKLAGSLDNLGQWGHEYLRHISGEISQEFNVRPLFYRLPCDSNACMLPRAHERRCGARGSGQSVAVPPADDASQRCSVKSAPRMLTLHHHSLPPPHAKSSNFSPTPPGPAGGGRVGGRPDAAGGAGGPGRTPQTSRSRDCGENQGSERDQRTRPHTPTCACVTSAPPPQIAPYHMSHNAEPEAVDLLLEVERLDLLEGLCDDKNYGR
jgi:hypothetical protein